MLGDLVVVDTGFPSARPVAHPRTRPSRPNRSDRCRARCRHPPVAHTDGPDQEAPDLAAGEDRATNGIADVTGSGTQIFATIVGLAFDASISAPSSGSRQKWPFQIRPTLSARHLENDRNQAGFYVLIGHLLVKSGSWCGHINYGCPRHPPIQWEDRIEG